MKASLEENTNIKQMIKCMKNYVQIYFHCQMCKKKQQVKTKLLTDQYLQT